MQVRNLPSDFSEEALSELFATFGVVESCRIAKQPHTQARLLRAWLSAYARAPADLPAACRPARASAS